MKQNIVEKGEKFHAITIHGNPHVYLNCVILKVCGDMVKFIGHNANINNQREVKVTDIHSLVFTNFDKPPVVIDHSKPQEVEESPEVQEEIKRQEKLKAIDVALDGYNDKRISAKELQNLCVDVMLGEKTLNPSHKLPELASIHKEGKRNAS